ncbi:hypothetical protein I79_026171 [Cricetulus griseus]|uniref:Uncharacterized protein n=1 Tax=Cricetulus griseus TaxID=10029 RepID=G3IQ74_CRIGR|nr:hypothetical protein I79_026171 [Cricetulus griseus]
MCVGTQEVQKRMSDLLELELQVWLLVTQYGCWVSNLGPLQEQQVLLTAAISLVPKNFFPQHGIK